MGTRRFFSGDRPSLVYFCDMITSVADWGSDIPRHLWDEACRGAAAGDLDLLVVLTAPQQYGPFTRASSLVGPGVADSWLFWIARQDPGCEAWVSRFPSDRSVCLSTPHGNKPVVSLPGGEGLKQLFAHLFDHHGYRRVAFFRGPADHPGAQERYEAYRRALADRNLPFDPALVTDPAPWDAATGEAGIQVLLDDRGLTPGAGRGVEAVVCASDRIALGCLTELDRRAIRVPADLAVVGYNNVQEAQALEVSLTSVAAHVQVQMARALGTLRNRLVPGGHPGTSFVLGESCGCPNAHLLACLQGFPGDPRDRQAVLGAVSRALSVLPGRGLSPDQLATDLLTRMETARDHTESPVFLAWLGGRFQPRAAGYLDQVCWQDALTLVGQHWEATLTDPGVLAWGRTLVETGRVALADIYGRAQIRFRQTELKNQAQLRRLAASLSSLGSWDQSLGLLARSLQDFGVPGGYLVEYETPQTLPFGDENPAARLLLAVDDGLRRDLPADGVPFLAQDLVPEGFGPAGGRRQTWVLLPLVNGEVEYGYWLSCLGPPDGGLHESLAEILASVLHNRRLTRDLAAAQARLTEQSKMAALGELVAGLAHEINTPLGVSVTAVSLLAGKTEELRTLLDGLNLPAVTRILGSMEESLDIGQRNLARASKLVDRFKQVAVDHVSGEERQFDLAAYLTDLTASFEPLFRRDGHRFTVVSPGPLVIHAALDGFATIGTNLILNSLQHGFEGLRDRSGVFTLSRDASQVRIEFSDNGRGMGPEVVRKVFDPFFTTKRGRGGLGLGMHIVYNLVVQKLGGTITCESPPGGGVRFVILFTG